MLPAGMFFCRRASRNKPSGVKTEACVCALRTMMGTPVLPLVSVVNDFDFLSEFSLDCLAHGIEMRAGHTDGVAP